VAASAGYRKRFCELSRSGRVDCQHPTLTASSNPEILTMLRPNFCSACGAKIIRLYWHPWTSRRFCDSCSQRLRKERLTLPLLLGTSLFCLGLVAGRAGRAVPPQLVIERSANSPLYPSPNSSEENAAAERGKGASEATLEIKAEPLSPQSPAETEAEVVYLCGARTKKGTPCSRRVHTPGRCWQHKGTTAMLPQEQLVVKD
jgi:hypothetical protein